VEDLYIRSQATDSMLMAARVELEVHLRSSRRFAGVPGPEGETATTADALGW